MTRIAVTGATGYVGRSFVSCLQNKGFDVVAISRSPSSQPSPNSNIRYCKNYCDTNVLANLFKECDCVVHLAGLAHRKACGDFEYELQVYRHANLSPIISIARAASMALVKRVVFVSSIGVNGTYTQGNPFTELDSPSPKEPYSIVKLEAERALSMELSGKITDWVVLRPPLVYGPGCPGNLKNLLKIVHRFLSTFWFAAKSSYIYIDRKSSRCPYCVFIPFVCIASHFCRSGLSRYFRI